jgi:hypothetical protein
VRQAPSSLPRAGRRCRGRNLKEGAAVSAGFRLSRCPVSDVKQRLGVGCTLKRSPSPREASESFVSKLAGAWDAKTLESIRKEKGKKGASNQ